MLKNFGDRVKEILKSWIEVIVVLNDQVRGIQHQVSFVAILWANEARGTFWRMNVV